jgi:hypothetical protein
MPCYRPAVRVTLAVLLVVGSSTAGAEPRAGALVLDDGEVAAELVIEYGLDKSHVGDPVSIAPDLWWGVLPGLTVGVIHSDSSLDQLGAGASLCVQHTDLRCGKTYRGSGADLIWSAIEGNFAFAPRARFVVRDLDPWKPAVTLGGLVRWRHRDFAITGDPYLRLGLANQGRGNRAALVVPVWISQRLTYQLELAVHTGFDSELAVIRDGYHIPIGLVARYTLTAHLEVGLEVGFRSAAGSQNDSSGRTAMLTLGWRRY